jgi:serine/threonine protein kinase
MASRVGDGAEVAPEILELYLTGGSGTAKQPYHVFFDGRQTIRNGVRLRYGHNQKNETVVQKSVPAGSTAQTLIAREARLGRRLQDAGARSYPPQLSRCVGADPDGPHPFTLMTCRGATLRELLENGQLPLSPAGVNQAVTDLLTGLAFLHTDRIVHTRIDLDSLRWDGTGLQICDFGHAVTEARTRSLPDLPAPWNPPRPARSTVAHPADDIYTAALAVFQLATGEALHTAQGEPETSEGMRARLALQDAVLQDLLRHRDRRTGRASDHAFADSPEHRPDARTMLLRWQPPAPPHPVPRPDVDLRETRAREDFTRLRMHQRAFVPPPLPDLPAQEGGPLRRGADNKFVVSTPLAYTVAAAFGIALVTLLLMLVV